ncbi:hypothetical protein ASF12_21230 [Paenibacillus sp. Leaf72]|nr:hypothetical protein ASF12_21230 [Paenibacillus sp. Leaf72]
MNLDILSSQELFFVFSKNRSEIERHNEIMKTGIDVLMKQVLQDVINKYQSTNDLVHDELGRRDLLKYLQ